MPFSPDINFGRLQTREDAPSLNIGQGAFATIVNNVIPGVGLGYEVLNGASDPISDALDGYLRGAYAAVDDTGVPVKFAGDAAKLYQLVSTTWTDKSKAGGYSNADDSMWEFTQFDDSALGDIVIATNFDDPIQYRTVGGSLFADLGTNTPKARHIASLQRFVVALNTNDSFDGNKPTRVWWCPIDNPGGDWTPSSATQADKQDLRTEAGWGQAIVPFQEYAIIFQERAVWRMTYVGGSAVFRFDEIDQAKGLYASRGVIAVGSSVFYISDDGFYALSGNQSIPIGADQVDKFFLNDLDANYLYRVTAGAYPDKKVIIWSYPGEGNIDGEPNKIILYNWVSQKWATGQITVQGLFRDLSQGFDLDTDASVEDQNLDADLPSLDSKVWMGGVQAIGAFDTDNQLVTLEGDPLDGTIETAEFRLGDGFSYIKEIHPLVDDSAASVQIGSRKRQADPFVFGGISTQNATGFCPVRATSQYHRARVNTTGVFNNALGIRAKYEFLGAR